VDEVVGDNKDGEGEQEETVTEQRETKQCMRSPKVVDDSEEDEEEDADEDEDASEGED
jgi:hypothetical protein